MITLKLTKEEADALSHALACAIAWKRDLVQAHTTELKIVDGFPVYSVSKHFRSDVEGFNKDISSFCNLANKIIEKKIKE
jgi:hypothetical protein